MERQKQRYNIKKEETIKIFDNAYKEKRKRAARPKNCHRHDIA